MTTNQDMLTKGSFTRDEWNNLLHLLNIMNLSTFSHGHFFLSNRKQSVVMSKRSQEGLSHDSPTVKVKSRAMNLVSHRNLSAVRQNSQKQKCPKIPRVTEQTNCPLASGDRCEEHRHKKRKPDPNFVTWRLRIPSTWTRSAKTCRINWQEYRTYQNLQWMLTPICWCGYGVWYHRWKPQYIWIQNTLSIWKCPRTSKFDDIESLFTITKRLITDNSEIRKTKCLDCTSPLHGRDLRYSMIEQ